MPVVLVCNRPFRQRRLATRESRVLVARTLIHPFLGGRLLNEAYGVRFIGERGMGEGVRDGMGDCTDY